LHRRGDHWSVKSVDKDNSASQLSSCMPKSGLYHYLTPNGKYKSAVIIQLDKEIGPELSKVLLLFHAKEKKIVHIETRKGASGRFQLYLEIESKSSDDWNNIRSLVETLNGIDIKPRDDISLVNQILEEESEVDTNNGNENGNMAWFPRVVTELDNFQRVIHYGDGLDADHPGFKDTKYRKRRRMFTEIAIFYKHGEAIPRIKYTAEEIQTWKTIYTSLRKLYDRYASSEFNKNFKELEQYCGYRKDNIPQLQDINEYLKKKTGFQVRPVAGYMSPRDFLAGLAFRVFHCTQYIRHGSDPFYTPEPDCVHEILGHMPMFGDANFAQFSQEIGLASLGASEEDLKKLAACYFFTVEFGLCVENNELKIYGAGLLSSVSELKHVVEGVRNSKVAIQRFTVDEAVNTQCVVTSFQKRYFYTNTIEGAKEELRRLAASIKKPFELRYNPYTGSVDALTTSGKIMDLAKELRGDMFLISNAMRKIQGPDGLACDMDMENICELLDVKNRN